MDQNVVLDLAEAVRLGSSGHGKAVRESAGLSQAAIAAVCGKSPSAVGRWEKGERVPKGLAALAWVRVIRQLEGELERSKASLKVDPS